MKVFDLIGFAAQMRAVDHDLEALGPKIVERACQIVQKKAQSAIGKEHELWAPLAESTITDKASHGFATPKPLLRTGELRDSIEYTVHGNQGAVGSNLDIAVGADCALIAVHGVLDAVTQLASAQQWLRRRKAVARLVRNRGLGKRCPQFVLLADRRLCLLLHNLAGPFDDLGA